MLVIKQLTVAIGFHSMEKKNAMEGNGYHQLFGQLHFYFKVPLLLCNYIFKY